MVEAVAACRKPDQAGLQALLAPVATQIAAADKLTGGRRGAAFNHFKAAADALPALAWAAYTGPSCGAACSRVCVRQQGLAQPPPAQIQDQECCHRRVVDNVS